jgi:catechol 2,3-dioxygenase-like lactoylglutathione lyase family enzyme
MKRFHVHVSVDDLAQSIRFYSTLFAAEPSVVKPDYAKWMLEDPRVNFAISTSGGEHTGRLEIGDPAARRRGITHLGIQVEDAGELAEVYDRLSRAERPVIEEKGAVCCYAKSDKQWVADPQGVPWETFLTHEQATVYGTSRSLSKLGEASGGLSTCGCAPAELTPAAATAEACCAPSCCTA